MAPRGVRQLVFLLVGLACIARRADATDGAYDLSLRSRLEVSVAFHAPHVQKSEFFLEPALTSELTGDWQAHAVVRLLADPADHLWPGSPTQVDLWPASRALEIGDTTELDLRELYLRGRLGGLELTLGKQQVVWGTADGIKILDVVDPQDFREFILDDFTDSRLPLWTINLEIPLAAARLQLLWIPDRSYHRLPPPGSVYHITSPVLVPPSPTGLPLVLEPPERPRRFLADSDLGLRISSTLSGWDLSLNYLYAYDDAPVPVRTVVFSAGALQVRGRPEYRRTHYIGGSFGTAWHDLVFRGELLFSTKRYVYTRDILDPDGIEPGNELSYVLGLDWFGPRETLLSAQIFERRTGTSAARAPQKGWTHITSLLFHRGLGLEGLVLQTFWLHDLERNDGLARGLISYTWSGGFTFSTGVEMFYGTSGGIFGEFAMTDHLFFAIEHHQ